MLLSPRGTPCFLLLLVLFGHGKGQNAATGPPAGEGGLPAPRQDGAGHSLLGLALLVVTVALSGSAYVCVLRYICPDCRLPGAVGPEEETLTDHV